MKLNPFVLMQKEFDDTGIVFDPESRKAMTLNKVGVVIWEAFEKGLSEEQIIDEVLSKFETERDVVKKDLAVFFETLKSKDLLSD